MLLDVLSSQDLWTILLSIITLALLNLLGRALYSFYTLGHIPGPWYTHLSNHILQYHEFHHNRTKWIHSLHLTYGPVVRISATEVHFNSMEAVRAIYGVRASVVKSDFYHVFRHGSVPNMFSTLDDAKHADLKRGIANVYSRSSIMKLESMQKLRDRVEEFIELVNQPEGVELYLMLSYLTLDVVSTFVYGTEARARVLSSDNRNRQRVRNDMITTRNWSRFWKKGGHTVLERLVIVLHLVLDRLNQLLEIYSAGEDIPTSGGVEAYISEACTSSIRAGKNNRDDTVVAKLISRSDDTSYILSETRDHVLAGSDITTTLLAFLFHTLATRIDVYNTLKQAISTLPRDEEGQIDASALDTCDYLDHVITEALRLFAAIPLTLPRVTIVDMEIAGNTIPVGTQVGAQCYSLHRDALIFTDPEKFDPSRWSHATKAMKEQMWAFSSGSRSCIGKALALLEMKLVVARVVQEYSLSVVSSAKDGMQMVEDTTRFTMVPKDRSMRMKFIRTT